MQQGAERNRLAARKRPSRAEIEPAALALLQRHGAAIMATARRFAATAEDAEDAYQRGVEILLTKAPTTAEEELVPWLRTVVKHEAWALRRQRQRAAPVADDGEVPDAPSDATLTHEQAERLERLRLGAEAMRQLKPQEVRALLLKAEGYSYKQIQEITGWTYTKVNRCLTEGRKAFLERVAGIEGGSECARLGPLLSKLVDGEASADDMATLRPHIRTCLTCRAALREYRAAPATAAALVPAAALASSRPGVLDLPARLVETLAGISQKAHSAVEMASAQKVAAVAASTAALAGGGTAAVREVVERPAVPPRPAAAERDRPTASRPLPTAPAAASTPAPVARPVPQPPTAAERRAARERLRQQRERARLRAARQSTPPAQQEFDPAFAASGPAPAPEPTASTAASTSGTGTAAPAPSPAPSPRPAPSGGGAEEFAP
jgi:RNA polymerase sigma factor (sigma-70 family)